MEQPHDWRFQLAGQRWDVDVDEDEDVDVDVDVLARFGCRRWRFGWLAGRSARGRVVVTLAQLRESIFNISAVIYCSISLPPPPPPRPPAIKRPTWQIPKLGPFNWNGAQLASTRAFSFWPARPARLANGGQ